MVERVYAVANRSELGRIQGGCVQIELGVTRECGVSTILPERQIALRGPLAGGDDPVLAITGETGAYEQVFAFV